MAVLGVACLVAAVHHLARVGTRVARPVSGGLAVVMALGTAAMLVPALDPLPAAAWGAVFVVGGAWSVGGALRGGGRAAVHHAVGCGAMVLMLLAGHAAHDGAGVVGVLALPCVAYLAWHLVVEAPARWVPPGAAPGAVTAGTAVRARLVADARAAVVAMAVVDVAMCAMLLGAL